MSNPRGKGMRGSLEVGGGNKKTKIKTKTFIANSFHQSMFYNIISELYYDPHVEAVSVYNHAHKVYSTIRISDNNHFLR